MERVTISCMSCILKTACFQFKNFQTLDFHLVLKSLWVKYELILIYTLLHSTQRIALWLFSWWFSSALLHIFPHYISLHLHPCPFTLTINQEHSLIEWSCCLRNARMFKSVKKPDVFATVGVVCSCSLVPQVNWATTCVY